MTNNKLLIWFGIIGGAIGFLFHYFWHIEMDISLFFISSHILFGFVYTLIGIAGGVILWYFMNKDKVKQNIGKTDKWIRIFVVAASIYLGYKVSAWFYVLAVWELFTISTRWCFVYHLLNINTLREK